MFGNKQLYHMYARSADLVLGLIPGSCPGFMNGDSQPCPVILQLVPPDCPQQNKWSPWTVYGSTSGPPRLFVVAVSCPPCYRTRAILTLFFCLASFAHLGLTNAMQCKAVDKQVLGGAEAPPNFEAYYQHLHLEQFCCLNCSFFYC